jgi:hypothetical protein
LRPVSLVAHAAAFGLAIVLSLYLLANRYNFPNGWVWQGVEEPWRLARFYLAFWWVEFGLLALLLAVCLGVGWGPKSNQVASTQAGAWVRRWLAHLEHRCGLQPLEVGVVAVSLAALTLLPLWRLGFSNDLAMRASIPSLWVLWLMTGKVLLGAGAEALRRAAPLRLRVAYGLLVVVVVAGSLTGLAEVARSLQNYRFGPPSLDAVATTADANRANTVEQRVGDSEAFFFRYLGK